MIRKLRVLVFDSGVGALSIMNHIRARYPFLDLDVLCDDVFFPYGEKQDSVLDERVSSVIGHFAAREPFDLAVIACNTASTVCLPRLRSQFTKPIVGVVPAIKPAAADSLSKTIGILATPATIGRKYTHELIARYASKCTVHLYGSTKLVEEAERKIREGTPNKKVVYDELAKLLSKDPEQKMDRIVLGCTHFPILIEDFAESMLDREIVFMDSGEAIASRVGVLLKILTERKGSVGTIRQFYTSQFEKG